MNFQKGVTYFEQVTNDDKRPDFLVRLPDNRLVVIDAKTIYSDYEKYTQEPDVTEQAKHLKAHVTKIRNTITSLGKKQYEKAIADFCSSLKLPADEDPIDLVLMFVNPEGALSAALQADSSIYELAQEKKVVLVTSATLVGALAIIHTLWVNDRAQGDYEAMTQLAESLVSGFGQFLVSSISVTDALAKAQDAHQKSLDIIGTEQKGLLKEAQALANLAPSKIASTNIKTIKKHGYNYTGEEHV
jgi:DNA recombination protein RmuC